MIYPIVAYGDPVLRKTAVSIDKEHPNLSAMIENMFKTMYQAKGVGLAAPQVGFSIRLFVVDATAFSEDKEHQDLKGFKKIFINAKMIKEQGEEWSFNEGCLSIPKIREEIKRKPKIKIKYLDENFNEQEVEFEGLKARIIQHEYDHIEGKLFIDHINPFRKRLIKGKLNDILTGKVDTDYKMKFVKNKIS